MDIHFKVPDLRRLDTLRCEAMAIGVFEDERPMRGALGLVDWRLCGAVSRLLTTGRLAGTRGERLLLSSRRRLPFDKIFLFGLGTRKELDPGCFEEAVRAMFDTLSDARIRSAVLALPGRTNGLLGPKEAMERFLSLAEGRGDPDEITLIEDAEAQKTMAPLVEQARRRARAEVA